MFFFNRFLFPFFFASLLWIFPSICSAQVVINEIHYDPDVKTQWVEFIELFNAGNTDVDLTGWFIRDGIEYRFPDDTTLPSGKYLIVAQNVSAVCNKYSIPFTNVFGPFLGRLDNDGERIDLCRADGQVEDRVDYAMGFPWPTVGNPIPANSPGNSHSIQLIHFALDNNLAGSWRSAAPTPGKRNSVYSPDVPPQIRQVEHNPKQPVSNQTVTITAKVTDPDGVASVKLLYQIVDPGKYIALSDATYQTTWTELAMQDDGTNGDAIAGDFVYTVQIPDSLQKHRRMIRYLIASADSNGNYLKVPYSDDPQPNFAYFVYDGVPSWTGAVRPGQSQEITYSKNLMSSLPVYHLISSKNEIERCTWMDRNMSNEYRYRGTLVYDGEVYDHVLFRARGGTWRYSMGKNMWKFNMNRGHGFQARDNWGQKYKEKWDKVNLGANIQQGDYMHRGEQGMFESVGFKLFNMMGQEASHTNFVHFRIIDEENEEGKLNAAHSPLTSSGTQFDGDFWGLYLATEQVDAHFLDEHDLPDGNLYKMEGGGGEIRNQSPTGVTDSSDLRTFMNGYRSRQNSQWWRNNTDIDRYINYRSGVEAIHQYDIAYGKNYYYYLHPETKKWFQIPWDLDLTWADNMFGNGEDPFKQAGILQNNDINLDYQNRMREIRDLLYNPEQAVQVIDEYASFIYDPDGESFVDADRAMWDYHWVMSNQAAQQGLNNPSKSGQGRFYQIAPTKDFNGMLTLMKNYVVSRGKWIDQTVLNNNANIPTTPTVTALTHDFKVDSLQFETSEYNSPNSSDRFAAMKWRIAEVEPDVSTWISTGDSPVPPQEEYNIHITGNASWKYFKGTQEPSDPRSAWRELNFGDSSWAMGSAPIGYGESFIQTTLSDMRGKYTSIYLRKRFYLNNLDEIEKLYAFVLFDDGFNMWINGVHVAKDHIDSEEMPFNGLGQHRENNDYIQYELSNPKKYLVQGPNIIAIQVLNQYLDQSSDCFIDAALVSTKPKPEPEPTPEPEPEVGKPLRHRDKPLRYEIDAVWESDEITVFQKQISIPAEKVAAGRTYRVRVKMKDSAGRWSHWSDPVQFTTKESDQQITALDNLRITELMYNPPGGSEYEFIELHNAHSTASISLGGFVFTTGINFTFPADAALPPGGYLVVAHCANEAEKTAFRKYYGLDDTVVIACPFTGKLANEGERITLKISEQGETLLSFTYNNGRGWPMMADGAGHSLVPLDRTLEMENKGSLDYGGNWRASAFIGGSPGKIDPQPPAGILISEVMANAEDGNDWIEIHNIASSPIHLGEWYLSDNETKLKIWPLPAMEIPAGGFLSFDAKTHFNVSGKGFGLSKNGEKVFLSYLPGMANVDRVIDGVRFKAQESNLSWGRADSSSAYWMALPPTRNQRNAEPIPTAVIEEIMYRPASPLAADDNTQGEYIELFNPTSQAIPLWNENGAWRLDGGVDYVFPSNTSLPAKGRLLVVSFDPQIAARRSEFMAAYSIGDSSVQIVGPYSGSLSNNGERIAIEKLLYINPSDGSLAWAIVDEAIYFDRDPWTPDADGTGKSLQRIAISKSGNDPANWKADAPTPGKEGSTETPIASWMLY